MSSWIVISSITGSSGGSCACATGTATGPATGPATSCGGGGCTVLVSGHFSEV